ncbi:MAG: DUF120 domain-containing protein [Methanomicrobiales archaeon]|nr:DUF120 domain-containing protein [Methanomicrobiales archaeon]
MTSEDLQSLKAIALMGGCRGPVWISSQMLATALKTSPQTAARRLRSLETRELIHRTVRPDGQFITVTKKGGELLKREYAEYRRIFESDRAGYVLAGVVVSGIGEGRYYMSLEPYRRQFQEKLGFLPFPGTLNIRLSPASIEARMRLELREWIPISGFSMDNRTFGDAKCMPCRIDGLDCAIIVPGRTHYPEDVIEVISAQDLRAALGVEDRDEVRIEIPTD